MASDPFVAHRDFAPLPVKAQLAVPRRKVAQAQAFLQQHLAAGPQPAQILFEAAQGAGIAIRTLQYAKDQLRVRSRREGGRRGQWIWHPAAMDAAPLALKGTGAGPFAS